MSLNPITIYKEIAAVIKVKGEISNMKIAELQTSSGRLTIIANILGIYSAIHGFIPPEIMAKLSLASIGIYTIGRAIVNAAEAILKVFPNASIQSVIDEVKTDGAAVITAVGGATVTTTVAPTAAPNVTK